MCCLFGFHDYGHKLTQKQRITLLKTLSIACEERGTDATGIAYNENGIQRIYKRPIPAHNFFCSGALFAVNLYLLRREKNNE